MYRRPRTKQEIWESKWATRGSRGTQAPQGLTAMPELIQGAIDSGWFRRGASLVDIGCGSGELAAMLSDRGFPTLGIDFAPSAIQLAGASHLTGRPSANLRFEVVDICADTSGLGVFENLIDRGCFHCLNVASHPDYGRNVAAMSAVGASFLMVCGLGGVSAARRETLVRRALGEYFLIEEVRNGGGSEGLAIWMTRR